LFGNTFNSTSNLASLAITFSLAVAAQRWILSNPEVLHHLLNTLHYSHILICQLLVCRLNNAPF